MRRPISILVAVLVLSAALMGRASAQTAPEFKLGFKALAEQVSEIVGQPIEEEHWGDNGDSLQQTTTGLMAWRKADNWTAFTNGSRTWVNGPFGVAERGNEERFSWESPAAGPNAPPSQLRVAFIDVGQGDAILIQSPDGKNGLIDGGSAGTGVVQYLRDKGVSSLDLVVATHPHEDHIGGLVEVLEAMPVARVVTSGQATTTRTYERFLDAVAAARASYQEVERGDVLALGGLSLEVISPGPGAAGDLNNGSVVLRLAHGSTTFLFMGDAERQAEGGMLIQSALPIKADVLKVGHHGSRTASSPEFLSVVRPAVAVYSAGAANSYGHPHPETLAGLEAVGAKVYGTDSLGTVLVTCDGAAYAVTATKDPTPRAPPVPVSAPPAAAPIQPGPTAVPAPAQELSLNIVSVSSPVRPGATATLRATATPGADCTITVYYKSGASTAAGLVPRTADASGSVSWSWMVGTNTTSGNWRIVVSASKDGRAITKETAFTVGG